MVGIDPDLEMVVVRTGHLGQYAVAGDTRGL
jgi:hypothetical protein